MYYRNNPTQNGGILNTEKYNFPLWLLILIIVLVLVGISFICYKLMKKPNTSKTIESKQQFGYNFY